jgi:Ca-activated chloride channel family protein
MKKILQWIRHPATLPLAALLLILFYCTTQPECRLLTADQRGYRAFDQGNYSRASQQFVDPAWRGASLYRAGEFKQAASLFATMDTADGAFNHGNSLVMQGLYEEAAGRYSRALELRPGWSAAERNLEIAQSRAKALEKKGGNMTDGKLGADDFQFSNNPDSAQSSQEELLQSEIATDDASLQQIWLRQVQTRPADFLRSKFAYQLSSQRQGGDE